MSNYKLYLSSEEELLRGLKQEYQSLEAEKMEEDNDTEVMKKSNCAIGCCTINIAQISIVLWGYNLNLYACRNGLFNVKITEFKHKIE